jgi:DNA-binding response OmpR family regulator
MDGHPKASADCANSGYRALVVDDEAPLAEIVASYLEREQFEVTQCHNGTDALALAREIDPDVVVLDLGLPGLDGVEVCRQLRTFSDAYVVMLTARDAEVDTIVGLSVGADDYITKPFSPRELVARIRAMLRRPRIVGAASSPTGGVTIDELPPRVFGPMSIDVASRQVFLHEEPIPLTRTEFDILAELARNSDRVVTSHALVRTVWGPDYSSDTQMLRVHISHLRQKIEPRGGAARYILTEAGVGYRFVGDEEPAS